MPQHKAARVQRISMHSLSSYQESVCQSLDISQTASSRLPENFNAFSIFHPIGNHFASHCLDISWTAPPRLGGISGANWGAKRKKGKERKREMERGRWANVT
jgi:hypothetical protein